MHLGDEKYMGSRILEAFAGFFKNKVSNITETCTVDESVHNGSRAMHNIRT